MDGVRTLPMSPPKGGSKISILQFAAGSFHSKKLCSRLYSTEIEFYSKNYLSSTRMRRCRVQPSRDIQHRAKSLIFVEVQAWRHSNASIFTAPAAMLALSWYLVLEPSSMLDRDWGMGVEADPQTQIFSHQCGGHLQPVGGFNPPTPPTNRTLY